MGNPIFLQRYRGRIGILYAIILLHAFWKICQEEDLIEVPKRSVGSPYWHTSNPEFFGVLVQVIADVLHKIVSAHILYSFD